MKILRDLEPNLRRKLLVLFTAGLLFWSSLAALLPTLPLYVESLNGTKKEIGIVMGAFAIGLLLFRAQLGKLADQRGRKLVLLIGLAAVAIAPLGYLMVQSIPLLVVIRAFHGISIAAFGTAYSALVVDISPEQNRGELLGYMSLVNPIGVALGPAAGGFLQAWAGYSPLFILSAGLGFLGLICALQIRETSTHLSEQAGTKARTDTKFWGLLFEPRFRVPTIVLLLIGLAFGTLSTFVPLFIQETKVNLNPGLFYTAAAIASFSIRLLVGRASDRYGRGLFITLSLICYSFSMFLLWSAHRAEIFLLAGVIEGAGSGVLIPMTAALLADRSYPDERGRTFGLCMAGFDLGIAIAGPSLGSIADQVGYRIMFGLAAGLAGLGVVIFMAFANQTLPQSLKFSLGQSKDFYALPINR